MHNDSLGLPRCRDLKSGEMHLNYLLDKKENQAKFVIIFLGVVGWVERHSVNNRQA